MPSPRTREAEAAHSAGVSTNRHGRMSHLAVNSTIAPVDGGAAEALADLHATRYAALVRLAAVLLGDFSAAEDVVQDAFVNVFRGWSRVRDRDQAARYLRSAVLNG